MTSLESIENAHIVLLVVVEPIARGKIDFRMAFNPIYVFWAKMPPPPTLNQTEFIFIFRFAS